MLIFKKIGPGLFYAAAAVGVSHLVQSSRAGASYGWIMVAIILLINVLKYPFFLLGPLYTHYKRQSLLDGFKKLGKWSLWLYLLITVATLYTTVAVIALICSSLFTSTFHLSLPIWLLSMILITVVIYLVHYGKFKRLSSLIKLIIVLLTIASIFALVFAFNKAELIGSLVSHFSFYKQVDVLFLIALIGWMPAPLDIITWQSEWTIEQHLVYKPTLKESLFDFNLGYWGTALLAAVFAALGTLVLFRQQVVFENSAVGFIDQLIELYTSTIGEFAYPFIAFAAIATMISTLITVIDAYSRVIPKVTSSLWSLSAAQYSLVEKINLGLILLISVLILKYGMTSLSSLVDFATSISFLTAPILAILYLLLFKQLPIINRNKRIILFISCIIGLIFLLLFGSAYIYYMFL